MRRPGLLLGTVLVLVFIAGVMRLNDLSLYTDSTRYLLWAESLSTGGGWADNTQPVPEAYVVNAPLYPVSIAPSQWLSGSAMDAAKILTLLYGLGALALFFLWTRRSLGEATGTLTTVIVAVLPMTAVLFTEVLSEALFLLSMFAVFFLLQDRERLSGYRKHTVVVLLALLPLIREIGLALVLAIILVEYMRGDRRLAVTIGAAAIGIFLLWTVRNLVFVGQPDASQATNASFIFQRALSSPDESIVVEFARRIGANVTTYQFELGGMIMFPVPVSLISAPSAPFRLIFGLLQEVKSFIPLLFVPMLLYGMWKDWNSGSQGLVRVLFVALSFGIVLVYPVQDVRFLYPFIPFILLFCAKTLFELRHISPRAATIGGMTAFIVVAVPNALTTVEVLSTNQRYHAWLADTTGTARSPGAYFTTPWEEAGRWIEANTPPGVVIASSAKEIAPFVGDRKLLEINKAVPRPQFEHMLRDHDVTILVAPVIQEGLFAYGFHLLESKDVHLEGMATIGSLAILRLPSLLTENRPANDRRNDTMLVSQPTLRAARSAILHGRYLTADTLLASLLATDPVNAEAAFQRVVALSLAGERSTAIEAQQTLFRAPRSTSYIPVSRRLIEISGHVSDAQQIADPSLSSGAWYLAGRAAWDLGYDDAARQYLTAALAAKPDAFEPLIWSAFYAIEDGDLALAEELLGRFPSVDEDDPIVTDLWRILALTRLLGDTTDPATLSSSLLGIAAAYERLELFDPAIDAAVEAMRLDPSDPIAKDKAVSLLRMTGKHFAADRLTTRP